MSGKLIMKRKLDKTHHKVEISESTAATSSSEASSSTSAQDKPRNPENMRENENSESTVRPPLNKRIRCDTPPPEPEDLDLPPLPQVNEQNRHLLEAIQLKMLELQNELDAFEHDVEAHEEEYYYQNDRYNQRQNPQMSEQEAEALGFAMCAQETMLFLQREGVPSDSLLYTRLRDALIGRSQQDRVFQL
ncbi:insensible isoform 1-T3 [Cochliomyia hominivorax]